MKTELDFLLEMLEARKKLAIALQWKDTEDLSISDLISIVQSAKIAHQEYLKNLIVQP